MSSYHHSYQPVDQQDVEMIPLNGYKQNKPTKSIFTRLVTGIAIGVVIIFVASAAFHLFNVYKPEVNPTENASSMFDEQGRYVMEDFDDLKPMSNFLNGLGGFYGVPMWAFYINRGQAIASFGKQNKDNAIYKFNTAEKAYQQTPFTGFRTFLKGKKGSTTWNHMPFFPKAANDEEIVHRKMMIGANELEIEEIADAKGIQTNILYFTAPHEDFPTLVRSVTFTNLDPDATVELDVLDGLGRLVPSGLNNGALDGMGRTMEAWMNVYNSASNPITHPFFHISQDTADSAQVRIIKDGHFAVAFIENGSGDPETGLYTTIPFIVDPSVVFGTDTTMTNPKGFFGSDSPSVDELLASPQGTTSRTPCSFAGAKLIIKPKMNVTITTIYGHAENLETFVGVYSPKLRKVGFVPSKRTAAKELVESITKKVETNTSSSIFNAYIKQDFLDNVLRGGLPLAVGDSSNPKIYHVFSRIHGDIERDYNFFQIDTTYFSQGPGNFRDVCQNRRLDVSHSPVVGDFNVKMFLSFVQADGFNPLTVATTNFRIPTEKLDDVISGMELETSTKDTVVKNLLSKAFRIGQFFNDLNAAGVTYKIDRDSLVNLITENAVQETAGQFAQNGYWADHWTYTLDLIENFLSVFPDKESELLWDSEPVPFFMSPAYVRPRNERYSLADNPSKQGGITIRVYRAISTWGDPDFNPLRQAALNKIYSDPSTIADSNGAGGFWQRSVNGSVFSVSPIAKLAMLGILKYSTLDPHGMGVEMEGGKPGWNDAMNGLPGIVGSGMPETYEMLKIIRYVNGAVKKYGRGIEFPAEFATMVNTLFTALDAVLNGSMDEFSYWDISNTAREAYREEVLVTFSGSTVSFTAGEISTLLTKMETKVKAGIEKAVVSNHGLSPSYFYYECTDVNILPPFKITIPAQSSRAECKAFKQHTLPLFLEGPTRHLKVIEDMHGRSEVYQLAKSSTLYDTKLKMFMICESLKGMGQDIGRMMAFSPGWLENQSIWLHMSYKFYLELLLGGLYEEFYEEIKTGLVPFMDNKIYGRSALEAASFIVSSAFPDPKLHGASFLARLSGSTAEMLSMWSIMMAGPTPFITTEDGKLKLCLSPKLPGWLFNKEGEMSFMFLGEVIVTYKNPSLADVWKVSAKKAVATGLDGTVYNGNDDGSFDEHVAKLVRSLKIKSIVLEY